MDKQVHIIQKQVYELNITNHNRAVSKQNEIQEWNVQFLLPALSQKLDNLFTGDEVIMIDKLELDLGRLSKNMNGKIWIDKILDQIDEKINVMKNSSVPVQDLKIHRKDRQQFAVEQWIFFLIHGYLQDNSLFKDLSEVKKELTLLDEPRKKNLIRLLNELQDSFQAVYRLVVSCTSNELFFHINLIEPHLSRIDWINTWQSIELKTRQVDDELNSGNIFSVINERQKIIAGIMIQMMKSPGSHNLSSSHFRKMADEFSDACLSEKTEKKYDKTIETNTGETINRHENQNVNLSFKEIFVTSAGLCLVASYLPVFLKKLLLTDARFFTDETTQQHAIYLLHFLANSEEDVTEEKLIIPKLLCGWPLQMPCDNPYPITEKEITESDELLNAMIGHWAILKNTSPAGLQQTFLQRNGKLILEDERIVLQTEQQSLDVLLEQVPWNFHTIKLPWMNKPLLVEWY
jgi:hypothetical protein